MNENIINLIIQAKNLSSNALNQVKGQLADLSKSSEKTSNVLAGMGENFKKAVSAVAIGAGIMGGAMTVLGGMALSSAGNYETMGVALETAFGGNIEMAKQAQKQITEFATKTPYDLNQVMTGFIKLKNMGLDPSEKAMTSYGNTASAMGKDLNSMVEAVADAATGEFERLKEFGIRASSQGDKVSFTFKGITQTVGKNSKEIEDYLIKLGETNFAGGMEKQSQTLNGKLSTLKDTFDQTMASFATNSGLLEFAKKAIDLANTLLTRVEPAFNHFKDVILPDLFSKFETAKKWVDDNKTAIEVLAVVLGSFAVAWGIVSGAIAVYNGAIALGTTLTTAFGVAVAFLTSPFGIAVLAISALITTGYLLYKNWELIKATAFAVGGAVAGFFAQKWQEIGNWFNWLGVLAIQKWNEMIAGVNALTSGITNFFGNMINSIINRFNNLDMWQIGSNIMTGLGNGLWAMVDVAMGPINWLASQVRSVLGMQAQAEANAYRASQPVSGKGSVSMYGFAKGGAFQGGNVVAFADGGVVNKPTNFAMSGGRLGLMGEAGAEAIMPLSRGKDGKLGVKAEGVGATIIINNPTFLSGDENTARQFVKSIEDQLFKSFQKFSKI